MSRPSQPSGSAAAGASRSPSVICAFARGVDQGERAPAPSVVSGGGANADVHRRQLPLSLGADVVVAHRGEEGRQSASFASCTAATAPPPPGSSQQSVAWAMPPARDGVEVGELDPFGVPDDGGPHRRSLAPLLRRPVSWACRRTPSHVLQPRRRVRVQARPRRAARACWRARSRRCSSDVLVAADTGDDAAVVAALDDDRALVATLDFFTPIVDDPYDWGGSPPRTRCPTSTRWAARRSWRLNIVALAGRRPPARDAGPRCCRAGSTPRRTRASPCSAATRSRTPSRSTGWSCSGSSTPTASCATPARRPGDRLFLTKPLGLGIDLDGGQARAWPPPSCCRAAVELMTTPNARPRRRWSRPASSAATDVTGFGLLGHLHEMLRGLGRARPTIDAARRALHPRRRWTSRSAASCPAGPSATTRSSAPPRDWGELTMPEQLLLADAQT